MTDFTAENKKEMAKLFTAFETLVPVDQAVIAHLVFKLAEQQKEISNLAGELFKKL